MTNVKSLLAMYVKMGGSLTDTYSDIAGGVPVGQYSTISDAILACSKKYSSGGGGLPADFPAEGAANKNKFLGFDNSGDYAALDAPSGAEPFYVEATITEESEEYTVAFDKTYEETKAAHDAGSQIFLIADDMNYALGSCFFDGSEGQFLWTIGNELDDLVQIIMLGDSGDTIGVFAPVEGLPEGVPSYSSFNNGQVLGVDDGDLAWVASGAPAYFDFTLTESGGQYTATPASGVTYEAIHTSARSGVPTYARCTFDTSELLIPFGNYDQNTGVEAAIGTFGMQNGGGLAVVLLMLIAANDGSSDNFVCVGINLQIAQ